MPQLNINFLQIMETDSGYVVVDTEGHTNVVLFGPDSRENAEQYYSSVVSHLNTLGASVG